MSKLIEGYYKATDHFYNIVKNEGSQWFACISAGNKYPLAIQYGDFGEADPKVQELTGLKNYNIKIKLSFVIEDEPAKDGDNKLPEFIDSGILYENGNKCVLKGSAGVSQLTKITEEEFVALKNDFDPIEAPPGNYKIQPENQGKIIWMNGAPGMGKSTTAQILARNHGFVYYEADCFGALKNPYVPLDVDNPSMAQMNQRVLGGPGIEERRELVQRSQKMWSDLIKGNDYDKDLMNEFYHALALDIASEKKRIGGDWAVASVLMTRAVRDHLRKILGPDLTIVNLTMSSADRRARVLKRHQGDVNSADMMDHFESLMEPAEEDEPNTIVVNVTSSMSREEVVEYVRKCIQ